MPRIFRFNGVCVSMLVPGPCPSGSRSHAAPFPSANQTMPNPSVSLTARVSLCRNDS